MKLDLTFVYRANAGEAHKLDAFGKELVLAANEQREKTQEAFRRNGVDIEAVDVSAQRIEAPVDDTAGIQEILRQKELELRGMLLVDSSVDDALNACSDMSLSAKPRVNIYRDLIRMQPNDQKSIPLIFELAKREGYEAVCIVLRAIGDHALITIDDHEAHLPRQYVSGDMTGASREHQMLCDVTNRTGIFSKSPVEAEKKMASNIALLTFLIRQAKAVGFTEEQLQFVHFLEDAPQRERLLIISDSHARQGEASENISADEVVLPGVIENRGFPARHKEALMHQVLGLTALVRLAFEDCVLPAGRRAKWLKTVTE